MARRKKPETPAPDRVVTLQASLVQQAIEAGVVPNSEIVELATRQANALTVPLLEALEQVRQEDPAEFARLVLAAQKLALDALEFKKPKLARVEHKVEGAVQHGHFVVVERREEGPKLVEAHVRDPDSTG